jgi:hypothetical protein
VCRAPQADRLTDQVKALREKAGRLAPGSERDGLLHSVEQDEVALRVIQWMTSSGHAAVGFDSDETVSIASEMIGHQYPGALFLDYPTESSADGGSQLVHGLSHMMCPSCHQALGIVVSPTDAY